MENEKKEKNLSIVSSICLLLAILCCIAIILFTTGFIIKFSEIFYSLGGEIPVATKIALNSRYILGAIALILIIKEKLIKKQVVNLTINAIASGIILFVSIPLIVIALYQPIFKIIKTLERPVSRRPAKEAVYVAPVNIDLGLSQEDVDYLVSVIEPIFEESIDDVSFDVNLAGEFTLEGSYSGDTIQSCVGGIGKLGSSMKMSSVFEHFRVESIMKTSGNSMKFIMKGYLTDKVKDREKLTEGLSNLGTMIKQGE